MLFVGLRDVAAQNVGDGGAVFVRSQEDVDFVPLDALVRLDGILQIADVAILVFAVSQRGQAAEIVEASMKPSVT